MVVSGDIVDDVERDGVSINLVGMTDGNIKTDVRLKCTFMEINDRVQPYEFRYYERILERLKMKVLVGQNIRIYIGTTHNGVSGNHCINDVLRKWIASLKQMVFVTTWAPGILVVVKVNAKAPLVPAYFFLSRKKLLSTDKTNWYHLPMRVKSTAVIPFIDDKPLIFGRCDDKLDLDESPLRRRVKLIDDSDG